MSGLSIKDGAEVECRGRRFIIMQLIGFDFVVARDMEAVRRRPKPRFQRRVNRLPLPPISPRLMIATGAKLRRRLT
jgi:hypothetical protein